MDIGVVGTENKFFERGSQIETKFLKKQLLTKNPFFVINAFCFPHSICLNIASWHCSFVVNKCVFNLSTFSQETVLWFFEKSVFWEIYLKVNALKMFKTFSDCHIKTCQFLKRRDILKIFCVICQKNLDSFTQL